MTDTRSASLVLIAGAVGVGYWWWHLTQGKIAPAAAAGASSPPASPGPPLGSGKLGVPVPLTGPDWAVGKVFRSDQEFSAAVNRAIAAARAQQGGG